MKALAELTVVLGWDQEYLLHSALRTLLEQVVKVVKVFGCNRGEAISKIL
jgi:hypothetical protein